MLANIIKEDIEKFMEEVKRLIEPLNSEEKQLIKKVFQDVVDMIN